MHLGDLVGQTHPKENFVIRTGIIIESKEEYYVVQWLSYSKKYWMEGEDSIFYNLNQKHLLGKTPYKRDLSTLQMHCGLRLKVLSKAA